MVVRAQGSIPKCDVILYIILYTLHKSELVMCLTLRDLAKKVMHSKSKKAKPLRLSHKLKKKIVERKEK